MKKSLPLLAGAIVVPLLAATVAALAATGGATEAPVKSLPPSSSVAVTPEAPVQLATTPKGDAAQSVPDAVKQEAPALLAADEPEPTTSTVVPTEPTTPVPPNQWPTPEPTTSPPASPIPSGGPTEMTISWDGLKCARSEAWIVETQSGQKMMCPGSAAP